MDEVCEEINLSCNLTIIQLDEDDNDATTKVAYTSTGEGVSNPWYFDSGCSWYMTKNANVLSTYFMVVEG